MPAEFFSIKIADVRIGPRHREPGDVTRLADSIRDVGGGQVGKGLLNPITLGKGYTLIAGRRRLAACSELGWDTIPAHIVIGDELIMELAEIDENLARANLTALEEGEHLVRRDELLTAIGERAKGGAETLKDAATGRWRRPASDEGVTTAQLAEQFGMSERGAQYRKQAALNIVADVRDVLRHTGIADRTTDLIALARMAPDQQRKVVERVTAGAKTVPEALRAIAMDYGEEPDAIGDAAATADPTDASERMKVVRVECIWRYRVDNPVSRRRGDRMAQREEIEVERHVRVVIPGDVLEKRDEGLRDAVRRLAADNYRHLTSDGWPVPQNRQVEK